MTNNNENNNNQEVVSLANYTITALSSLAPEKLSAFDECSKITLTSASGETIDLIIEDFEINGIEWADEEKNADGFHIPLKENKDPRSE